MLCDICLYGCILLFQGTSFWILCIFQFSLSDSGTSHVDQYFCFAHFKMLMLCVKYCMFNFVHNEFMDVLNLFTVF